MLIKAIVFDLDGTLFDTRQDIVAAVNHARKYFRLSELSMEEIVSMVGYGVDQLAARCFMGTGVPARQAQERILEYYAAHPADKATPYPGVRETLPLLKPRKAVVSNKPFGLLRDLLEQNGISHFFEMVAGGDTFSRKKPDPEALIHIMREFGVQALELLVVGDHTPDIEMARRAGCHCAYCRYGFFGRDEVGADYQIDSFTELPGVIEKLEKTGNRNECHPPTPSGK
jgi:phosphoglycolate phosphatase